MDKLKITHEGELNLNGFKIPCYVLEDGTRILSSRGMQDALKLVDEVAPPSGQKPGTRMGRLFGYSAFKPFFLKDKDQDHFKPIICYKGNAQINGYEATTLADICDAILDARRAGVKMTSRQLIIAEQCELLIRAFARVGIIALVDEATGYQYDREKDELQKIHKAYIADDMQDWQLTFLNRFYQEIFRLRKWTYTPGGINKRPGVVGIYTIKYIYNMLPTGVFKNIKAKTPRSAAGNTTARYFQFLTPELGYEHLKDQFRTVTTLLQVARNWAEYEDLFARRFGQRALDFDEKPAPPKELPPAKPENEFDASLKGLLSIPPPPKPEKRKKKPPKDESGGEQAGDLVPA